MKITQINTVVARLSDGHSDVPARMYVYALCDDGEVWVFSTHTGKWFKLPPIGDQGKPHPAQNQKQSYD
jgi:hypothetical protein